MEGIEVNEDSRRLSDLPTTQFRATGLSDWKTPSVLALIAANLLPLYGVLFLGWKVFPVILLFWIENVIIGGLNVLKMVFASPANPVTWLGKIVIIPFFCVHYGLFTFIHGIFVMGLFGGAFRQGAPFPQPASFIQLAEAEGLQWPILALALSHGFSFVANYIGGGEYQRASLSDLMQQPYGRVVVMHVTLLGSGFLLMMLRSPIVGLVLLIVLKTILDVRAHTQERRKFGQAPLPNDLENKTSMELHQKETVE